MVRKKQSEKQIDISFAEFDESDLEVIRGILPSGIPYVAEILKNEDNQKQVTFLLPEGIIELNETVELQRQNKIIGIYTTERVKGVAGICVGMITHGEESNLDIVKRYVYFLEKEGAVSFISNNYNGAVEYLTDVKGNELIAVNITLYDNDDHYADAELL